MEIKKIEDGNEYIDKLMSFVFLIYQSTGGNYPRLEWLVEKPAAKDFYGFDRAYRNFLKYRINEEFDELYIIEEEKIIATFALVYKFENKSIKWIPDDFKNLCGFLEFFMVHPARRGQGLGKEIIEFSQDRIKEMEKRFCVVTFQDLQAYPYYRALGFTDLLKYGNFVLMER